MDNFRTPNSYEGLNVGLYDPLTSFVDHRLPFGRTWKERLPYIVENIRSSSDDGKGPHFLILVEMNKSMLSDLSDHLPHYSVTGAATMIDKRLKDIASTDYVGELILILYRSDLNIRQISEVETVWLSPTPTISCSKDWENGRYARAVVNTRFNVFGKTVSLFGTHYDDLSRISRKHSIDVETAFIKKKMSEYPDDIIVAAGYRNWYPDQGGAEDYQQFSLESGLKDARNEKNHYGLVTTWLGYENDRKFRAPVNNQNSLDARIYDVIFSNVDSKLSYSFPGQFDPSTKLIQEIEKFSIKADEPLYTASNHTLVGAIF